MKLSASSLNLFLRCPYAYYLKEIEKAEPVMNEGAFLGKLIHKTLENYFNYKKQNQNEDKLDIADFLEDSFKQLIKQENIKFTFKKSDYKDIAVDMLQNYNQIAKTITPLETEKYFEIYIDDVYITGYIDLLTQDRKLIDFKTSQSKNVKINSEYVMQISLYSMTGLANNYYLHFITPYNAVEKEVKPLKSLLFNEIINQFKNSYLSGAFVPSGLTHPYACNYCTYKQACKFYSDFDKTSL